MISTKEIGLGLTKTVTTIETETYSITTASPIIGGLNMRNH
jgi:hypothetical protein